MIVNWPILATTMQDTSHIPALDQHSIIRSSDIDDARTEISRKISPHDIEMASHADLLDVNFSGVHLGGIALLHAYYGCSIKAKPEHSEYFYTHTMLQGNSEIEHGSNQCDTIAGDTVVLSPSVPYNMHLHEKCDRIVIRIDPTQVKSQLSNLLCSEVDQNLGFDLTVNNANSWWNTINYILCQVENEPRVLQSRDVQQAYAQLVISNLLEFHNHNYVEQLNKPTADLINNQVKAAIDYVQSRVKKNTSLAQLASHCNVSARTLQRSFVKHIGMTPTAYVRDAKLTAIHLELQNLQGPANGSIKRVLLDYNIVDFSRFGQYYRQKYGCTPKQTLEKNRPTLISLN